MKNVNKFLNKVNPSKFTNNSQKVLAKLLKAEGEWVSRKVLAQAVPSAAARVRDLRKSQYGGFQVECAPASALNRRSQGRNFYYRINPQSVTQSQLNSAFRIS